MLGFDLVQHLLRGLHFVKSMKQSFCFSAVILHRRWCLERSVDLVVAVPVTRAASVSFLEACSHLDEGPRKGTGSMSAGDVVKSRS